MAAVGQRPLWDGVTGCCLAVVPQQFLLTAELQVAHVTGEELHSHMGEGVGDARSTVWKRGSAHPAEPQLRQVRLTVSSDGSWICWECHCASFTCHRASCHLEEQRPLFPMWKKNTTHPCVL